MKNIHLFIKFNIEGYKYLLCQTLIILKIFNDYTLYSWAKYNYMEYEKKYIVYYDFLKKEIKCNKRLSIFKQAMSLNNMLLFSTYHILFILIVINYFSPKPIHLYFIETLILLFAGTYFLKQFYNFDRLHLKIKILKNEHDKTEENEINNQNTLNFNEEPITIIAGFLIFAKTFHCSNKFTNSRIAEFIERNFLTNGNRFKFVQQTITNINKGNRFSDEKVQEIKKKLLSASIITD